MFIKEKIIKEIKKKIDTKEYFNIDAIFKGQSGYLGYVTNKKYFLEVGLKDDLIYIDTKFAKFCLYESLNSFLANWEILKIY